MGKWKCQIGATEFGVLGNNTLTGMDLEPAGPGVVGLCTLYLISTVGTAYSDVQIGREVRVWETFDDAGAGVAQRGRKFGGFVASIETSRVKGTSKKQWAVHCVDYNILFDMVAESVNNTLTVEAATFEVQIRDIIETKQGPAARLVNAATQVANLTGATVLAATTYTAKTWREMIQDRCDAARNSLSTLRPLFFMGVDNSTWGVGDTFGSATLHIYDGAVAPSPAWTFDESNIEGTYRRAFGRGVPVTKIQSKWAGGTSTAEDAPAIALYPNPYLSSQAWLGKPFDDNESTTQAQADDTTARVLRQTTDVLESISFDTRLGVLPGDVASLTWAADSISAKLYRVAQVSTRFKKTPSGPLAMHNVTLGKVMPELGDDAVTGISSTSTGLGGSNGGGGSGAPVDAFRQGGNTFGAPGALGTNDAQALMLETDNTGRAQLTQEGDIEVGGSGAAGYLAAQLADTPLALWKLDETSGTAAADASGNGRTGTLSGAVTLGKQGGIPGSAGSASEFGGGKVAATLPTINTGAAIYVSVETLLYWDGTLERVIVGFQHLNLHISLDGLGINTVSGDVFGVAYSPSWQNRWLHVVVVFKNGDAEGGKLYLNGVAQTCTRRDTPPDNTQSSATTGFNIGAFGVQGTNRFSGRQQHVAVYNGELSAARVLAHYNALDVALRVRSTTRGRSVVAGRKRMSAAATQGHLYVPDMDGAPTGVPSVEDDTLAVQFRADGIWAFNRATGSWVRLGTSNPMSNPMTATGDLIYAGTGGAPTRLPKGSDGQVLKLAAGLPAWGTDLTGSGSATHSYVGKNAVGASAAALTVNRYLLKKITLGAAGILTSISAHVAQTGAGTVIAFNGGLFTDNAGAPSKIIAYLPFPGNSFNLYIDNGTYRWLHFPMGVYLDAGDYWIAFGKSSTNGTAGIKYDAGGVDKYFDTSGAWFGASDIGAATATTTDYSIRGSVLTV